MNRRKKHKERGHNVQTTNHPSNQQMGYVKKSMIGGKEGGRTHRKKKRSKSLRQMQKTVRDRSAAVAQG